MEWMLQVVDEIDDVVCAGRHRVENLFGELGRLPLTVAGIFALGGALAAGVEPALIGAAAILATFAGLLRARTLT